MEEHRARRLPRVDPCRAGSAGTASINEREFRDIRTWIHQVAGINLSDQKKALVVGRLAARLKHYRLGDYGAYFRLLKSGAEPAEVQVAIDRLTTNETHFFREQKHFDFLRETILPGHAPRHAFRAWSAAASTGEEPY